MGPRRLITWNAYSAHWSALHGGYDLRRSPPPVWVWIRLAYIGAKVFIRARVSAGAMAGVAFVASVGVPVAAYWHGVWPLVAAGLVLLACVADSLEEAISVMTRRVSRFGYVTDSVLERICEVAWLTGFWVLGAQPWMIFAAAVVSLIHEYLRVRATAAGMPGFGAVTLGERPMRAIVAIAGFALCGTAGIFSLTIAVGAATLVVAAWLLFGLVGLLQLYAAVHRALA